VTGAESAPERVSPPIARWVIHKTADSLCAGKGGNGGHRALGALIFISAACALMAKAIRKEESGRWAVGVAIRVG